MHPLLGGLRSIIRQDRRGSGLRDASDAQQLTRQVPESWSTTRRESLLSREQVQ